MSIMKKMVMIAVGLILAIPLLTVIFGANGPVPGLLGLFNTGGIFASGGATATPFAPVFVVLIGLLPVGVVLYLINRYTPLSFSRMGGGGEGRRRRRSRSRSMPRQRRSRRRVARIVPVPFGGGSGGVTRIR